MSWMLRIILMAASILTTFWILRKIRKSQVKIEDAIFWLLFSLGLIVMSVFPQLVEWASNLIGIVSPVNFIFLAIIFLLLIKLFLLSIKVSQQDHKLQTFAQRYAIKENSREHEKQLNCEAQKSDTARSVPQKLDNDP